MKDVLHLLELEREAERRFVAEAAGEPDYPSGWPAAVLMAHIARWREQLRGGLIEASRGEAVSAPPADIDAFNAVELARSADISLEKAATRADVLLGDLIDLWATLGDRPFSWYIAKTTGEALVRNSYAHARNHLAEHFIERGDRARGYQIYEESATALRRAEAPPTTLGTALYNLACSRVGQHQYDEALRLLEEALPMRADIKAGAAADPDLEPLRIDPRFQALLKH
jgi:tetratricopeptide (TPR) repeat protein